MGCDIHLYLEEKIDGKWTSLDEFIENSNGFLEVDECLYSDRDYDFFAVLAGVRNGCDFVPISEPRGLPHDCSSKLLRYHNEGDYGFHSHSWLGYKEILKYYIDLDFKYVEKDGWVTKKDYDFFKVVGRPSSYFGGGGGEPITNEEMEKLDPSIDYERKYKTLVQWKESYYECVGSRLDRLLEEMKKYSTKKVESDIRICFWFDN